MLQMFPDMTIFFALFAIVFILAVVSFVVRFVRSLKSDAGFGSETSSQNAPVIKEREIIREIIKIRCSYCGNLYDEKEDKCPHCGGKRPEFQKA